MILHDIRCKTCDREERDVQIRGGVYPRCRCGGETTWIPRQIHTDMGSGFYCEATGMTHMRHRDAELTVAKQAREFTERTGIPWHPTATGDKVHGARNERRKVESAFSYAGQSNRRSRGEGSVQGGTPAPPRSAPSTTRGGPQRITRDDAARIRRSPVYTP